MNASLACSILFVLRKVRRIQTIGSGGFDSEEPAATAAAADQQDNPFQTVATKSLSTRHPRDVADLTLKMNGWRS